MNTREAIRNAAQAMNKPATPAEPKVAAPAAEKPVKEPKAPREKAAPKEPVACRCQVPGENGCNGGKTRKLFAPGHDAKLVGYLTREVVAGNMTQDKALETIKERSENSAHLVSKLQAAIPRELGKVQRKDAAAKAKADAKAEKEAKLQAAREEGQKAAQELANKNA
jgi:hypothetical protein